MKSVIWEVEDSEGTKQLGQMLAQHLPAGSVIALIGTLGAGKTLLVQAVAEALGIEPGIVVSPTFVLLHEYDGGVLPVYHFDVYRLADETEFRKLHPDDYFEGDGLTFVEWADKFPTVLPEQHLEVRFEILTETQRRFIISAAGEQYRELLLQISINQATP